MREREREITVSWPSLDPLPLSLDPLPLSLDTLPPSLDPPPTSFYLLFLPALNLVPKTEMELQYELTPPEPVVDGYMVLVYQVLCNVRRYSMPLQHDGFMQHVVLLFLTAYVLKYCDDVVLMVLYCLPQVRTWALSCTVHCSNTMPDG